MSKIEWNQDAVKKAAEEFSSWQGDACIMVDTSDGDVWTDVFIGNGSFKRYHSKTVKILIDKRGINSRNCKISAFGVHKLLEAEAYKYDSYEDMPLSVINIDCKYAD